jgi:hypothetical protein
MNETEKYIAITFLVFLAIVLFSALFISPKDALSNIKIEEGPLKKTRGVMLAPGETYSYDYKASGMNESFPLTYEIKQGRNCIGIELAEAINRTDVCIDSRGNDDSGTNLTLGTPYFYIFAPYMLAVNENWSWNASVYGTVAGRKIPISETSFLSLGNKTIYGRDAYFIKVVTVEKDNNITTYRWIDREKAVLLKESGNNYELAITEAPFTLQQ